VFFALVLQQWSAGCAPDVDILASYFANELSLSPDFNNPDSFAVPPV